MRPFFQRIYDRFPNNPLGANPRLGWYVGLRTEPLNPIVPHVPHVPHVLPPPARACCSWQACCGALGAGRNNVSACAGVVNRWRCTTGFFLLAAVLSSLYFIEQPDLVKIDIEDEPEWNNKALDSNNFDQGQLLSTEPFRVVVDNTFIGTIMSLGIILKEVVLNVTASTQSFGLSAPFKNGSQVHNSTVQVTPSFLPKGCEASEITDGKGFRCESLAAFKRMSEHASFDLILKGPKPIKVKLVRSVSAAGKSDQNTTHWIVSEKNATSECQLTTNYSTVKGIGGLMPFAYRLVPSRCYPGLDSCRFHGVDIPPNVRLVNPLSMSELNLNRLEKHNELLMSSPGSGNVTATIVCARPGEKKGKSSTVTLVEASVLPCENIPATVDSSVTVNGSATDFSFAKVMHLNASSAYSFPVPTQISYTITGGFINGQGSDVIKAGDSQQLASLLNQQVNLVLSSGNAILGLTSCYTPCCDKVSSFYQVAIYRKKPTPPPTPSPIPPTPSPMPPSPTPSPTPSPIPPTPSPIPPTPSPIPPTPSPMPPSPTPSSSSCKLSVSSVQNVDKPPYSKVNVAPNWDSTGCTPGDKFLITLKASGGATLESNSCNGVVPEPDFSEKCGNVVVTTGSEEWALSAAVITGQHSANIQVATGTLDCSSTQTITAKDFSADQCNPGVECNGYAPFSGVSFSNPSEDIPREFEAILTRGVIDSVPSGGNVKLLNDGTTMRVTASTVADLLKLFAQTFSFHSLKNVLDVSVTVVTHFVGCPPPGASANFKLKMQPFSSLRKLTIFGDGEREVRAKQVNQSGIFKPS